MRRSKKLNYIELMSAPTLRSIKTVATPAYTLSVVDVGSVTRFSSSDPLSILLMPEDSDLYGWQDNDALDLVQFGAGPITITPGDGVVINTAYSRSTSDQYDIVRLRRIARDVWTLTGDLAAMAFAPTAAQLRAGGDVADIGRWFIPAVYSMATTPNSAPTRE